MRVEDVLDAERDPVQRTARGEPGLVESARAGQRRLRVHVHPRADDRIAGLDSLDPRTYDRLDGRASAREPVCELDDRE